MRLIMVGVLLVGAVMGFMAFRFLNTSMGLPTETLVFEVPTGASFRKVAEELEQKGLIPNSFYLRIFGRVTGQSRLIKRGEYRLHRGMTPQDILTVLASGRSIQYPVTFPEGSNIFEMAVLLESKGFFSAKDFLVAVRDPNLIRQLLGEDRASLEGYLFPETYQITKFTTLKELVVAMVGRFKTVYGELRAQIPGAPPLGLNTYEIVTLASVVEKETGAPEERPMIASVFYNRLRLPMRLQSDPTIIYGIWVATGEYKQNITRADLQRPTPYNTYTVARLPAGPIANPGRESLAAVLHPPSSSFLYFVSRNDGTHVFSRTYDEHARAVRSFQLQPSAREGKSWRDLSKRKAH